MKDSTKNEIEASQNNVQEFADETKALTRRRWLKTTGGAALLLPVVHLAGCSDAAETKPAAKAAAPAPKATPKPAATVSAPQPEAPAAAETSAPAAGGADLVKIEADDPIAKALQYTANAAEVDTGKNPRFAAGQNCGNCAQYKAAAEAGWGTCGIFPGKLVAEVAWCSGYAPAG